MCANGWAILIRSVTLFLDLTEGKQPKLAKQEFLAMITPEPQRRIPNLWNRQDEAVRCGGSPR
jgi:hypothetical protein